MSQMSNNQFIEPKDGTGVLERGLFAHLAYQHHQQRQPPPALPEAQQHNLNGICNGKRKEKLSLRKGIFVNTFKKIFLWLLEFDL